MDFQKEVVEPLTEYFNDLEIYGIIGWSLIGVAILFFIIGLIL